MKITMNIDCTPEEARRFMGLPDLAPLQEAVLEELREQMVANIRSMQPEEMMKTWLPMGMESWVEFQKSLWKQFSGGAESKGADESR